VPPGARWARGSVDVLAWRRPEVTGSRIHLRAPDAAEHALLIEHEQSESLAWWPIWRDNAPAVLSDHGGALQLTTSHGTRQLSHPDRLIRFGRADDSGSGDDHRIVLDCSDASGRVGLAVVDLDEPAASVSWAPAANARVSGVWTADHGDTAELVVQRGDTLCRYTRRFDRQKPLRPLEPAAPSAIAVPPGVPISAPPSASRSFTVPTGFDDATLTLFSAGGRDVPGPLLLWIVDSRPGQHAADRAPIIFAATGYAVATLDLPLHWPAEATLQMLHGQIVDTVRAALHVLTEYCGDQRAGTVVVAGHSFGATLALYALAHVPELAAAIAHSGCYNRTHTPTGFQHERRSYWTVPAIYHAFSALHFADQLDRPVLIVHGAEDINPATPPEQAIDLYRGIVAAGGCARLVVLPYEGHNFRHLESLRTLIQEHRAWLDQRAPALARC
jgi:pimeloyl-ACP methyl ester carboxylesterase